MFTQPIKCLIGCIILQMINNKPEMFLMRFKNNKASHSLKENLQELTWNQGRYVYQTENKE